MLVLSRVQSREVDRLAVERFGMSTLVLMENAGRGVADHLVAIGGRGTVAIVGGRGNNAGDGFVVARHLHLRRVPVQVLLSGAPSELKGDAATNFAILSKTRVPMTFLNGRFDREVVLRTLAGASWVVDALLGTGATGEARPPMDEIIQHLNDQPAPILAVDVPSGLDCDSGTPSQWTVRARVTCTFGTTKPGYLVPEAKQYTGEVRVLDIGAPPELFKAMAEKEFQG